MHQRVQSFGCHGRNHHEDDQQHQQYVNERCDVDISVLTATRSQCHCHKKSPLLASAGCGRRGRLLLVVLLLLGQQTQIVYTSRANVVHDLDYRAVFGSRIRPHVHPLINPAGKPIFNLLRQLVGSDLVVAKEDLPVAHHGDNQRIFLVSIRHRLGTVDLRQVHAYALLQHGGDHHEDDQQHQHHVHHGSDVDVGVNLLSFIAFRYCHGSTSPAS